MIELHEFLAITPAREQICVFPPKSLHKKKFRKTNLAAWS